MKISNIKILYKILACFVLLGTVVVGVIWFATSKMKAIDNVYSEIIANDVLALQASSRFQGYIYNFNGLIWRLVAEDNYPTKKKIIDDIEANRKAMSANFILIKKHAPKFEPNIEQTVQVYEKIHTADYLPIAKAIIALDIDETLRLSKAIQPKLSELHNRAKEIINELEKNMQVASDAATAETNRTIAIAIASPSIALALVLALAFALVRFGIGTPLAGVVAELKKLAAGDFNVSLPWAGRKDEIGQIAAAAEMVAERVGATISNIKMSARDVASASVEISTSTTDLSQRTEAQAASLEETSASMDEMTSTVKKNAENAQEANKLVNNTREAADRGGKVVAKAVEAMAKIEGSSHKISDIIVVIDEIARQTNLLALNAAVEAARAGEAGRGFAVVASEVRNLAQRSSQAAKDIKELITSSSGQVKDGVDLVSKAGAALIEIVESIKKVTADVTDIANASMEQSSGIEQIKKVLMQMDEVTQQNTALVEENAATAKTLEQQAKVMDERVAFFRLRVAGRADSLQTANSSNRQHSAAAQSHAPKQPVTAASRPLPPTMQKQAGAGRTRSMPSALATAVKQDPEWKEL